MFSHCSNCDILDFCRMQTTTLHNSDFLSEYTTHTHNCFLLGREKNGHGTISWLHVSAVVHNSAIIWPIHEIIDCSMYNFGADPTEDTASNNPCIVVMGSCLAISEIVDMFTVRYRGNACSFLWLLHSNSTTCYNITIAQYTYITETACYHHYEWWWFGKTENIIYLQYIWTS
jgi:hypothetical protein